MCFLFLFFFGAGDCSLCLVVSSPSFRCSRLLLVFSSPLCASVPHVPHVYLVVCSLFCVLSAVALLPAPPVVVGHLPPLVCRSPVAVFLLVFSLLLMWPNTGPCGPAHAAPCGPMRPQKKMKKGGRRGYPILSACRGHGEGSNSRAEGGAEHGSTAAGGGRAVAPRTGPAGEGACCYRQGEEEERRTSYALNEVSARAKSRSALRLNAAWRRKPRAKAKATLEVC
jgi:hypothetical protein